MILLENLQIPSEKLQTINLMQNLQIYLRLLFSMCSPSLPHAPLSKSYFSLAEILHVRDTIEFCLVIRLECFILSMRCFPLALQKKKSFPLGEREQNACKLPYSDHAHISLCEH